MNWTTCKENSGRSSHQILMERTRREKRLKLGCLKLENISNYITIPPTWKLGLTYTICKERLLCGGIN
jgi:hypothetical protein